MRLTVFLTFTLLGLTGFAQVSTDQQADRKSPVVDEAKLYEDAYFQVNHKGESAFTTDIESLDGKFNESVFQELRYKLLAQDGVFKADLIADHKVIRIYHLSYLSIERMKEIILPYYQNFHPSEREPYQMN